MRVARPLLMLVVLAAAGCSTRAGGSPPDNDRPQSVLELEEEMEPESDPDDR